MQKDHEKLQGACLLLLTFFSATGFLYFTRPVLLPFTIAALISLSTLSLMSWLHKTWRFSRFAAITVALIGFTGTAILFLFFSISSVQQFIDGAGIYQNKVLELTQAVSGIGEKLHVDIDAAWIEKTIQELPVFSWAKNVTGYLLTMLGYGALIFIFTMFLIVGDHGSMDKSTILVEIQAKVSKYVSMKLLTSLGVAIATWIMLVSFNIELAVLFSALAFLFNFIPTFGAIFSVALPLPLVFLQYGVGIQFYIILGTSIFIQIVTGNVIETKLFGQALELHPITVLLCLLFWGLVWGVPGMFLAVPVTAVLNIILGKIEATKTFSNLLKGSF